jgi:Domain of unknown function (DUF4383)
MAERSSCRSAVSADAGPGATVGSSATNIRYRRRNMTTPRPTTAPRRRAPIQLVSAIAGVALIGIGILGFIPGITRPYSELDFAGLDSQAAILGIFQVSVLLNLIHLISGVLGLVGARSPLWARNVLLGCGIFYLALFLYGILVQLRNSQANIIPVDSPDNFLHLIVGIGLIAASILLSRGPGWRRTITSLDANI